MARQNLQGLDREELVKETLDSVRAQTYPHWECIIVDDGSTDHSVATARAYAARDSRFKVFQRHREPKGAPTCRNIGLEKAEGELVIFFDSDDIMLDYCLENRVKYFDEDENLDLLISYQMRMENGKETFLVNVPTNYPPFLRFYSIAVNQDIPWVNNSTTIPKRFLHKNGIRLEENIKGFQDVQFHLSILSVRPNLKWMSDKFDSYWRNNANRSNIGRAIETKDYKNIFAIYESYLNVSNDRVLQKKLIAQYQYMVIGFILKVENYATQDDFTLLIDFVRKSRFSVFTVLCLKGIKFLKSFPRRNYFQRFILYRMISLLKYRYQPVIRDGLFLKQNDIKCKKLLTPEHILSKHTMKCNESM